MWKHFLLILFVANGAQPASLIFGRRVYASAGKTYQKIWSLDPASRKIAPLSNGERRHVQPACTPDGKRIWFLSGAFGEDSNTQLWSFDPRTRTEKMAIAFNGSIMRLLGGSDTRAFFTAFDGPELGLYRWDGKLADGKLADGKLAKLSTLSVAVENPASLSPDAKSLAVQNAEGVLNMMDGSGLRGRAIEGCSGPVWSPDGTKIACVNGRSVRVVNLTTGLQTAHHEFTERTSTPAIADYSRDGAHLMVGTVGANHSSTYPQSDYWVLDIANGKWSFVGPGQSAIFSAGGGVLLVTPRDLSKIGKGKDWVSQLLAVDLGTHAQVPVAAGNASNAEPCRCIVGAPAAAAPAKTDAKSAAKTGLVPLSKQHP